MSQATAIALLVSVLLTTGSQLLMKFGMTSRTVRAAITSADPLVIATQVAFSPWIISGLSCFALSVGLWLSVLSKVDVSKAYPCVALGFVLTMLGGHFLFGEAVSAQRILGLAVIVAGVGVVAVS